MALPDSGLSPFRQSAIDRLASPEQLDSPVQAVDAKLWLAAAGFALAAAAVVAWGFAGTIVTGIPAAGFAGPGDRAVLYLPAQRAAAVHPGQAVFIAPRDGATDPKPGRPFVAGPAGLVTGRVVRTLGLASRPAVSGSPGATNAASTREPPGFPNDDSGRPSAWVEVRVDLDAADPDEPAMAAQPDSRRPGSDLAPGTPIFGHIVLNTQRPIVWLLPCLRVWLPEG